MRVNGHPLAFILAFIAYAIAGFLCLLASAIPAQAAIVDYWYTSSSIALTACNAAKGSTCSNSPGGLSTQCPGTSGNDNYYHYYISGTTTYKYHYCVTGAGPECPSGQSWSNTLQTCSGTCPAVGTAKQVAISRASQTNAGYTDFDIDMPTVKKPVVDGAEYSCSDTSFAGSCFTNPDNHYYCNYNCTATGVCNQTSTTTNPSATGKPAVSSASGGTCITDTKGNQLCNTAAQGSQQCGTVNGQKVCYDKNAPGTGTVNGQVYDTSGKNCTITNGKPVCVSSNDSSSTTQACLKNGGASQCVNSDVKTQQQTTTTANPDGSTTKTTVTTNNVIGDGPSTTITTTNPDGSSTSVTTNSSGSNAGSGTAGQGSGTGTGSGTGETDCDKYPNSVGCQSLSNLLGDIPEGESLQSAGGIGDNFSYTPWDTADGCPASVTLKGGAVWDYGFMCDNLAHMKPVVILISLLIAAFIIAGGL